MKTIHNSYLTNSLHLASVLLIASALQVLAEPATLPPALLSEIVPTGAVSVSEAKANLQPGQKIVVRGRVGGTAKPLAETAAILVLADEKTITACSDIPGDTCPTAWDYCCEPAEKLRASTATVQVKDAAGKVIRAGLRDLGGLRELSIVIVEGTVDPTSQHGVLLINAERIHVVAK